jgi:hypothetical protein
MTSDSMVNSLQDCLSSLDLEGHSVGLVDKVQAANLFLQAHKPSDNRSYHLGSEYHRLKYIEELMPYISAVPIVFNPEAPRSQKCVGHYVPIKSTIEQMLNDATYKEQASRSEECDCIAGVFSGSCFKSNKFFVENPTAVPILLYSDGLCLTNPLNANAAKKNKLLGVYMTLGTVAPWNRTRVDSTQLVMVLNEKDYKKFGSEIVFKQLIKDLKGLCYSRKH